MIHLILPILLLLNDLILFQFGLEYQKLKGSYVDLIEWIDPTDLIDLTDLINLTDLKGYA